MILKGPAKIQQTSKTVRWSSAGRSVGRSIGWAPRAGSSGAAWCRPLGADEAEFGPVQKGSKNPNVEGNHPISPAILVHLLVPQQGAVVAASGRQSRRTPCAHFLPAACSTPPTLQNCAQKFGPPKMPLTSPHPFPYYYLNRPHQHCPSHWHRCNH